MHKPKPGVRQRLVLNVALPSLSTRSLIIHHSVDLEVPCGPFPIISLLWLVAGLLQQTRRKRPLKGSLSPNVPELSPLRSSITAYAVDFRSRMVTSQS